MDPVYFETDLEIRVLICQQCHQSFLCFTTEYEVVCEECTHGVSLDIIECETQVM